MKLTKEDYMRLPKERLAELLVELTDQPEAIPPLNTPPVPVIPDRFTGWGCDGVHCTNPLRDCINCPQTLHYGDYKTSPNTAPGISTLKAEGK